MVWRHLVGLLKALALFWFGRKVDVRDAEMGKHRRERRCEVYPGVYAMGPCNIDVVLGGPDGEPRAEYWADGEWRPLAEPDTAKGGAGTTC